MPDLRSSTALPPRDSNRPASRLRSLTWLPTWLLLLFLLLTSPAFANAAPPKASGGMSGDVRNFGAVCNASAHGPNPGTWHDDASAIQAAMEYVHSHGGQVYFPPLVCYTSVPILYKGQSMGGEGKARSFIRGPAGNDVFYAIDPLDPGFVNLAPNTHIHDMSIVVDDSVDATQSSGWAAKKRWAGQNSLFANQKWTNTLAAAIDAGPAAGGLSTSFTVVTPPPNDYDPINPNHKAQTGCVKIDAEIICYADMGLNLPTFGGETATITALTAASRTSATFTAGNSFHVGQDVLLSKLPSDYKRYIAAFPVTAATPTSFTIGQGNPAIALPLFSGLPLTVSGAALTGQLLRGALGTVPAAHAAGAAVTAVNPFTGATPSSPEGLTEDWPAWQIGACGIALPKRDGLECQSWKGGIGFANAHIENVAITVTGLATGWPTSCAIFTQRQPFHMALDHSDLGTSTGGAAWPNFGFIDEYPAANADSCITLQATMDTASFDNVLIGVEQIPFSATSGNYVSMEQIGMWTHGGQFTNPSAPPGATPTASHLSPAFQFPSGLVLKGGYTLDRRTTFSANQWVLKSIYNEPAYSYSGSGRTPPYIYSEVDGPWMHFIGGTPNEGGKNGPTVFNGKGAVVDGSGFGAYYNIVPEVVINGNSGKFDFYAMNSADVQDNGLGNVITSQNPYTHRNVNLTLQRGFSGQVAPDALVQGNISGDSYSSLADLFILPDDISSVRNTVIWSTAIANDPAVPITGRFATIAAPGSAALQAFDVNGAAGNGTLAFSAGAGRMPVGKGTFYVIAKAAAAATQTWTLNSSGGSRQTYGSSPLALTANWSIYSFPYDTSAALADGNTNLVITLGVTSPVTTVSLGGMMFVPRTDTINAGTINTGTINARTINLASAAGLTVAGSPILPSVASGVIPGAIPGATPVVASAGPAIYTGVAGIPFAPLYTPQKAGMFRACAYLDVTVAATAGTVSTSLRVTSDGHRSDYTPAAGSLDATLQWANTGSANLCQVFYADAGAEIAYALLMNSVTGSPSIRYAISLERLF